MPRNGFWNSCRTQGLMCVKKIDSSYSHLHSGATQPRCALPTQWVRGNPMIWGVFWDLQCCGAGAGAGAGRQKQKGELYPRLWDTHHNQEAVVALQGCWSSVFCRESNIPVLGHKTDHVCKTQFSGELESLVPEGHSNFHPVSIRDVY